MANPYKYQVNFEKLFIEGTLKGLRYHDYLRFCTRNAAAHFAARDGLIVTPCCGTGAYRQECSIVSRLE
jgi:hypothetical protein